MISGLPGSGKTTLARRLAGELRRPMLDKDEILEALYDSLGVADDTWRGQLSRAADNVMMRAAPALGSTVLVSWWQHPNSERTSGTPSEWLDGLPGGVVEIYCECPPDIAAARFRQRLRHPGHLDASRNYDDVEVEFAKVAQLGPLGYGAVLRVATETEPSLEAVLTFVRAHES